jgi:hypothetical protein
MRAHVPGLISALALVAATTAQAATPPPAKPCVTADKIKGFVAFALPGVVDNLITKCSSTLRPNGYFNSRGIELVRKLSIGKEDGWPMAIQAVRKMGGPPKGKNSIEPSDATMRTMIDNDMIPGLLKGIPVTMCRDIEAVVETLDPLPAANMVQFIASIFGLAGRGGSTLRACPPA